MPKNVLRPCFKAYSITRSAKESATALLGYRKPPSPVLRLMEQDHGGVMQINYPALADL